ncbi:unnamed protein product [Absidia cylindrospora]
MKSALTHLFFFYMIAFTKCKRNIRDGFRLENMSWRLWYREAIIRKRLERDANATDLVLPAAIELQDTNISNKQLVRTRSLPSLSCQAQHIRDSCQTTNTLINEEKMTLSADVPTKIITTTITKRSKFYIDQDDSDVDSLYDEDDMDCFDIDDDDDSSYSTDSASSSFDGQHHLSAKPMSLLTHLLQKESNHVGPATAATIGAASGGLRRSHCYGRLDQWFSGALSS